MASNEETLPSTDVQAAAQQNVDRFPKFDDMPAWQVAVILFSLGSAFFLFAIEATIVATSVSSIGTALQIEGSLSWLSTSYLLTTTAAQPVAGRLADALGIKRLLLCAIWIFVIGNVIAGTAQHGLTQIVAGRLISGVGGALLVSFCGIIISQLTHERQRSSYMNLINVTFLVSDSIGPIVGGALARSGNWRWIFLMNAPFGPVITVLLVRYLHLPPSSSRVTSLGDFVRRVDLIGMLLIAASLSFLVVTLNIGGQTLPWNSPTVIGFFCAFGVALVIFVVAEKFAQMPIMPLYLFKEWNWRNVPLMIVCRTLLFFHITALVFYTPVFLQVLGIEEITAAALIIPFLITAGITSTISNSIAHKFGFVRPILAVSSVILPVGLGLMSMLNQSSSIGKIVGYSLIVGVGFGCGTQLLMVVAQIGLPHDLLPTVTALVGCTPSLGGVLGVGILGTIINNRFRQALESSGFPDMTSINLNNVVTTVHTASSGLMKDMLVEAYVKAWKLGCWTLAGIAVVQFFLLVLLMKPVEFDAARKDADVKMPDVKKKSQDAV